VKGVIARCIATRLLDTSGTSQDLRWDKPKDYGRYGKAGRWSDFQWTIWNDRLGHPNDRFELFTLPG
jgi:hypothetical protein